MFKALLLSRNADKSTTATLTELEDSALPPGDVTVRVAWSTLNYKDALAVTGRGAIVKTWPMVAGIDLAGTVEASSHPDWQPGDAVVVNSWGLGETHWGGLAQKARVSADWLLQVPAPYSPRDTMAIGTAGYTGALCVQALLRHGITPDKGPVLVTGGSGGVGVVAVALLAGLGFEVHASSGRPALAEGLKALGAAEVIDRATLAAPGKPLQSERWAGVVDTVGSHTLANACAATRWNGAVAACGLAGGADFPATVMPFILRGVTLYGINCVYVPNTQRAEAWALLARHLPPARLTGLVQEIGLSEAIAASADLLDGRLTANRVVVDVNR
ncbi:MDR family oxidoreductase [Ideonella sp. B508-1]|uniref:acrylyl-CoA reductase (NADPH) n=1 Tax=Ideonella sp. B508-1 TaxID=137716 RepID=UPI00034715CF|nr:MDR family oxidoreductase [Ideonella sp. B508-1]